MFRLLPKNPSSVPASATSSTTETGAGGTGGGSTRKEEKDGQSERKQRRCWSPELHRRFLHSLQQLGGLGLLVCKRYFWNKPNQIKIGIRFNPWRTEICYLVLVYQMLSEQWITLSKKTITNLLCLLSRLINFCLNLQHFPIFSRHNLILSHFELQKTFGKSSTHLIL